MPRTQNIQLLDVGHSAFETRKTAPLKTKMVENPAGEAQQGGPLLRHRAKNCSASSFCGKNVQWFPFQNGQWTSSQSEAWPAKCRREKLSKTAPFPFKHSPPL